MTSYSSCLISTLYFRRCLEAFTEMDDWFRDLVGYQESMTFALAKVCEEFGFSDPPPPLIKRELPSSLAGDTEKPLAWTISSAR